MTKQNIMNHKETFGFPPRPQISHHCQHLIASLIQDKETRLCSKRYRFKDSVTSAASKPGQSSTANTNFNSYTTRSRQRQQQLSPKDFAGRYVFPMDAEDIKAHKWFRSIPWDRLHEIQPPLVPHLTGQDDTRYFDEEEDISDWSESESSECDYQEDDFRQVDPYEENRVHTSTPLDSSTSYPTPPHQTPPTPDNIIVPPQEAVQGKKTAGISRQKEEEARLALRGFRPSVQNWALEAISKPYDSNRLRDLDTKIEGITGLQVAEKNMLKQFLRVFGRKDRKRARDRLLRDQNTKGMVMEERKKTAFAGYTWRRMRPPGPLESDIWRDMGEAGNENGAASATSSGRMYDGFEHLLLGDPLATGIEGMRGELPDGYDGFRGWGDQIVAIRAMQRGQMSLQ